MTALVVLREKVIKPLLAASQQSDESHAKPNHPTPADRHYEHLRVGMRDLFYSVGHGRIRIGNLFFIFFNKLLTLTSIAFH
jgi:hypothetical protein